MWIVVIIGIIAILIFSKYSNDKTKLRNKVVLQGGLDQVFNNFIECIQKDFAEYKIVKMSETEIEIFTLTKDGRNFVFANKLGFGSKVNYRCDPKRSNFLTADIVVEGNVFNQVQSYQMILGELTKKYNIGVLEMSNSFVVKEFYCHYEDGSVMKELRNLKEYKNDKLIKLETFNRYPEKEEFFYVNDQINYSVFENDNFINKNWYYYNDKNLLIRIETDSFCKEYQDTRRFISKTIEYDNNGMILEEKNMLSFGKVYETKTNEYDKLGNKIVEIIAEEYSYKKNINKYDEKNKLIEQEKFTNKYSLYPDETIFYEYDETNNIIKKTLKYSSYSFLTIQYYNEENKIQKEETFNTENKLKETVNYLYNKFGLAKIENSYEGVMRTWTEFVFE